MLIFTKTRTILSYAEENCPRKKLMCDKLWPQDQTAYCAKPFAQYANL